MFVSGRGGGERKFSIRARSGVGVSSSNWIIRMQVTNVSFLLGANYRTAAEKGRGGERGGREKPPVGAGTYAKRTYRE